MLVLREKKGGNGMNLFFVFLGIAAWQDLRMRRISLDVLAGGAVAGIITCVWKARFPGEIILAMIPGIGLLTVSILTGPNVKDPLQAGLRRTLDLLSLISSYHKYMNLGKKN